MMYDDEFITMELVEDLIVEFTDDTTKTFKTSEFLRVKLNKKEIKWMGVLKGGEKE